MQRHIIIQDVGKKQPFRLGEVRSTSPRLVAVLRTSKVQAGEMPAVAGVVSHDAVDIQVSAPTQPGSFDAQLEVYEGGGSAPVLTVPVCGRVVPRFQLSPDAMLLPRRSGGGLIYSARCVCTSSVNEVFDLALLSCPAGMKAVVQRQSPSRYLVEVEVSPDSKEAKGSVMFQVASAAGKETLELPVLVAPLE